MSYGELPVSTPPELESQVLCVPLLHAPWGSKLRSFLCSKHWTDWVISPTSPNLLVALFRRFQAIAQVGLEPAMLIRLAWTSVIFLLLSSRLQAWAITRGSSWEQIFVQLAHSLSPSGYVPHGNLYVHPPKLCHWAWPFSIPQTLAKQTSDTFFCVRW